MRLTRTAFAAILAAIALMVGIGVSVAPAHAAPKHLVAPARIGSFDISTYRTCYYGSTYRLALTIWWGQYGGGTTAPNLVQQRYQKWVNGAWTSNDWASSMNSDYRQGTTILNRVGPLNPPASYNFDHGGASVGPSTANVRTRASGSIASIDCTQYAP